MRGSMLVMLALMLVLAGCGQKGALHREDKPEAPDNASVLDAQTISTHLC
ncbi:LPS translocon maturation chaperone LptM [Halomonadaceae bacterium KBTZ08]